MAVPLTILTDPRDPAPGRTLPLPPATSILRGAHAAGIDITATCGGRGRCTSCRVKFVTGTVPPPTIMDEIQLGDDQVREGYRLSCQCVPSEAVTVQVAPPLEERAFQILGAGPGVVGMGRVTLDSGIRKQVVKVGLPREEHHQTSDLEQLAAALGVTPADVGLAVLQGLPGALRDDPAGVTVTTFAAAGGAGGGRARAGAPPRGERGGRAGRRRPPPSGGLAPHAPVMRPPLVPPARELFLKVAPEPRVCLLPLVAGFVGADAVAVPLAPRIYESAEIRIAGDIGTNGEVLLGSRDRLWACSAPAGPALEGAQIRHRMRGALGAIDRVTVDDDLPAPTIGEADAPGISGSGLVDPGAGLLPAGALRRRRRSQG